MTEEIRIHPDVEILFVRFHPNHSFSLLLISLLLSFLLVCQRPNVNAISSNHIPVELERRNCCFYSKRECNSNTWNRAIGNRPKIHLQRVATAV